MTTFNIFEKKIIDTIINNKINEKSQIIGFILANSIDEKNTKIIIDNKEKNITIKYKKEILKKLNITSFDFLFDFLSIIDWLEKNNFIYIEKFPINWGINTYGDYNNKGKTDSSLLVKNKDLYKNFISLINNNCHPTKKIITLKQNNYFTEEDQRYLREKKNSKRMFIISIIAIIVGIINPLISLVYNNFIKEKPNSIEIKINQNDLEKLLSSINSNKKIDIQNNKLIIKLDEKE